jgi:hypothetical protein
MDRIWRWRNRILNTAELQEMVRDGLTSSGSERLLAAVQ